MLFIVIMVICLLYYAAIVSYAGFGASFAWFWLIVAGLSGAAHLARQLIRKGMFAHRVPLWLTVSVQTTLALGIALAVFVEVLVISGMFAQTDPADLDYLIVLGAHVNGETPSKSLRYRLDKAIEYLEENDELKVIVSGGQGTGEDVTEAYAMATYLLKEGIAPERIRLESESTNTRENLIYSCRLIEKEDAAVGIVTNSFHVFRAAKLAERLGMETAVGIAAPSDKLLLPSYLVREFFAIVKEKIMGYI